MANQGYFFNFCFSVKVLFFGVVSFLDGVFLSSVEVLSFGVVSFFDGVLLLGDSFLMGVFDVPLAFKNFSSPVILGLD